MVGVSPPFYNIIQLNFCFQDNGNVHLVNVFNDEGPDWYCKKTKRCYIVIVEPCTYGLFPRKRGENTIDLTLFKHSLNLIIS